MKKDKTPAKRPDERSIIEEVAKEVPPPDAAGDPKVQSPVTSTGLPVEEQVRKEWDPRKGGLPTFCR